MLRNSIKGETLKVKRSPVWFAFILTPLIPALMGAQNYLNNLELLKSEWFSLWTQETLFYSNFFYAPLIAVYCSYLWRLENTNKNRHLLLLMPIPVRDIILAKFITIFKIALFTQCWVFLLYLISGKAVGLPALPPVLTLFYMFRGLLGGMVIASLQLLLSMLFKSFALPVVIAAAGSVTGLLAAGSDFGIFYPYSLMMLGMNANKSEDMLAGNSLTYLGVTLLFLLLFLFSATFILKHRDS